MHTYAQKPTGLIHLLIKVHHTNLPLYVLIWDGVYKFAIFLKGFTEMRTEPMYV